MLHTLGQPEKRDLFSRHYVAPEHGIQSLNVQHFVYGAHEGLITLILGRDLIYRPLLCLLTEQLQSFLRVVHGSNPDSTKIGPKLRQDPQLRQWEVRPQVATPNWVQQAASHRDLELILCSELPGTRFTVARIRLGVLRYSCYYGLSAFRSSFANTPV